MGKGVCGAQGAANRHAQDVGPKTPSRDAEVVEGRGKWGGGSEKTNAFQASRMLLVEMFVVN